MMARHDMPQLASQGSFVHAARVCTSCTSVRECRIHLSKCVCWCVLRVGVCCVLVCVACWCVCVCGLVGWLCVCVSNTNDGFPAAPPGLVAQSNQRRKEFRRHGCGG